MYLKQVRIMVVAMVLGLPNLAAAVPDYLAEWRTIYPSSQSGDIGCQLCHANREGGDPWNAYGHDIRSLLTDPISLERRTFTEALAMSEILNSDNDSPAVNNLSEIAESEQPGWREGQNNRIYDRNDNLVGFFFPPLTVDPFPEKILSKETSLTLVDIARGFTAPLAGVVSPVPQHDDQLFIVDQIGIVWRVSLSDGVVTEYLDLKQKLVSLGAFSPGGYDERGLLSIAFHPNFEENGMLYTYTSEPLGRVADFSTMPVGELADHQAVISEIQVQDPSGADGLVQIESTRELLRIDQPQFNHNGGQLLFDENGHLFIALGDGGGSDDQGVGHSDALGNGSDPTNPLGAILRIDPFGNNAVNMAYGVPTSNPFFGDPDGLDEIYAYGFRNPWKMSFDANGELYVADVGQNDIEEVSKVELGGHYGWPFKEGRFFFDQNGEFSGLVTLAAPDELPGVPLIDPLFQYDHDEGISITGGHVYRGAGRTQLFEKYVFADVAKRLFVGDIGSGEVEALDIQSDIFIYAIARDAQGELYLLGNESLDTSGQTGKLLKIQSPSMATNDSDQLCLPIVAKNKQVAVVCL